jgi:hypothetical protein
VTQLNALRRCVHRGVRRAWYIRVGDPLRGGLCGSPAPEAAANGRPERPPRHAHGLRRSRVVVARRRLPVLAREPLGESRSGTRWRRHDLSPIGLRREPFPRAAAMCAAVFTPTL